MLNRYLVKTLFKGASFRVSINGVTKMSAMKNNICLFRFNKMTFFDYDNKDKNLFSSDDESRAATRGFGDDYSREPKEATEHQGKFDPDDIPLYIYKMRNELNELKRRNKDVKCYFPRFKNFVAMHFQNRDRIYAEFPRSSMVMFEYSAFRNHKRENNFLKSLEENIAERNLQNMPIPGIKNFVSASVKLGRGRQSIMGRVIEVMTMRKGYNDVKSNINILSLLTTIRA